MLRVHLKPSLYLAAALVAAHLGSALVLIPLTLSVGAKLAIVAVIVTSLTRSVWVAALLRSPTAIVAVEVRDEMCAALQTREGQWHEARILGTTFVTPLLTVLNLRVGNRRLARHAVIVPDSTSAEDFRRLRVLLRWGYRKEG